MSNTRIGNILNARKSANSRSLRVKAEDLSLYNEYKESLNSSNKHTNKQKIRAISQLIVSYLFGPIPNSYLFYLWDDSDEK